MPDKPPGLPIAPGKDNTIVDAPNVLRLPLGWSETDHAPRGSTTWFWVTIPTNTGGTLTITHEGGGTVSLWTDGMQKRFPATGDVSKLEYTVMPPFTGGLMVLAEGGSPRSVSAMFVQVGYARDVAAPKQTPIVPWNFFFWPASRKTNAGKDAKDVLAMIRKFARAFGKDEKAASEWEFLNHQVSEYSGWAGHCHHAARASILFEEPVAQTVGGESFTEEELEFLAAEWTGNYAVMQPAFTLNKGVPPRPVRPDAYLPAHFKPGEPKTPDKLAFAFQSYDSSFTKEKATELAKRVFAESGLSDKLRQYFREVTVEFYKTLIQRILVEGHPLIADLRSMSPDAGPAEVWNHAVFYYRATYQQVSPQGLAADDFYDMNVKIELFANEDVLPSTGLPARITPSGGVEVGSAQLTYRKSVNLLRLVFDSGTGEIAAQDPRNEWLSCKASDGGGELYAPAYLGFMDPVPPKPAKLSPPSNTLVGNLQVGNPHVELELISGTPPVLKLRRRYKK